MWCTSLPKGNTNDSNKSNAFLDSEKAGVKDPSVVSYDAQVIYSISLTSSMILVNVMVILSIKIPNRTIKYDHTGRICVVEQVLSRRGNLIVSLAQSYNN